MRIIVTGGRKLSDTGDNAFVRIELTRLHERHHIDVLAHGCTGDYAAALESWARRNGIAIVRYPPNWQLFGHQAEFRRNLFMLADARADLVVAFPGGESTSHLVQRAIDMGLAVLRFPPAPLPDAACVSADVERQEMEATSARHGQRFGSMQHSAGVARQAPDRVIKRRTVS